jgi:hypothetical protein
MRRHLVLALALVLGYSHLLARGASGAPLAFTGTLSARIDFERPGLPPLIVSAAGSGVASLTTIGSGRIVRLALAGGEIATAGLVFTPTPATPGIRGVQFTASNGTGSVTSLGTTMSPPLGGVIPIFGIAKVCLFAPCSAAIGNLTVPLNVVGAGGITHAATASNNVGVTVVGAPWTTGAAAVGTISAMGFVHGPHSLPSTAGNPSGQVLLVTPVFVSTNLTGPGYGFATLALHFVPEPGTFMLLGLGVAGLVAMGLRRR